MMPLIPSIDRKQYGSVSILAHMILILPHPFTFKSAARPPQHHHQHEHPPPEHPHQPQPSRRAGSIIEYLRARYLHQPLEGFSQWISPTARVYQGLTPQFKVFLQMSVMILGGVVWAERRVTEYIDFMRKVKRVQRVQAERESNLR